MAKAGSRSAAPPEGSRILEEFGEQWSRFRDTGGYFGSLAMLRDFCGPLISVEELAGLRVLDVGSGAGRFANMFLDAGAARVIAVEPSAGMDVLKANTRERADRMDYIQTTGERIPPVQADIAFSIGVLHHLEDPTPTVRRVFEVLEDGGRFIVWLYGREGNKPYILFAEALRFFTRVVPDSVLVALAHLLNFFLGIYMALCRTLPLPLRDYMQNVMSKMDSSKRFFLIFDQLNPGYAKYYTGPEARGLLEACGFVNVRLYHRHNMSWTAIGEKPSEGSTSRC